MKFIVAHTIRCLLAAAFSLAPAMLALLAACASAPNHPEWIRVGVTTKAEVTARYGQPDLMMASSGEDIAIYRPTASGPSAPQLQIPTAQAGPFGLPITGSQPINPGLGARDLNGKAKERLGKEIRIRYDDRGIVRELISP
jgi:hypothetical protein